MRTFLNLCIYGLCALGSVGAAELTLPLERTFSDTSGRALDATLLEVEAAQIFIRRNADGARFWIPVETLSQGDRTWLERHFKDAPKEKALEPLEWPDRAKPAEPVKIEIVEETFKEGKFIYASQHFQYEASGRLTRTLVREFAEVFEATYAAVMAMPLPWRELPPDKPMRVKIFGDYDAYLIAGGFPNSGGLYRYRDHTCLVPVSSLGLVATSTGFRKEGEADISILLHEVTHQVMHHWRLPVWLTEGIALYMERIPYSNGTLYFRRFDGEKAVKASESSIRSLGLVKPERLFNMSSREWNDTFHEGDLMTLRRNYLSAFVYTAYFLHLEDDETAHLLRDFAMSQSGLVESMEVDLLKHSSGIDIEERVRRALRRLGIQAHFY